MDKKAIALGVLLGAGGTVGVSALAEPALYVKQLDGKLDADHKELVATVDKLGESWDCKGRAVSMTFLAQDEGGWAYHVGCPVPVPAGLLK